MSKGKSIRIPIHGFVNLSDWEWDIINHPVFQRLRRIRQLAFSEHVYPGSVHTRFEHSIGVMHIATRLFESLIRKHKHKLKDLKINDAQLLRAKSLVRLAALLHDVGHGPFSHSAEELAPCDENGKHIPHEVYSAQLISEEMKDVIDDNPNNRQGLKITGKEVADFYLGNSGIGENLRIWRELVNGQWDADRMDYLLRDSYHCGVTYGHFDLDRIVDTITFVKNKKDDGSQALQIAVEEGGKHAAEGLILARYFMFTQVYFHPVRIAYDHHAEKSLECYLSKGKGNGMLPNPKIASDRKKFKQLDDWTVMNFIKMNKKKNDRHGNAILFHQHDRVVHETSESPTAEQIEKHEKILQELQKKEIDAWEKKAEKSWYKTGRPEIQIASKNSNRGGFGKGKPLNAISDMVAKIPNFNQRLIFVPKNERDNANQIISDLEKGN